MPGRLADDLPLELPSFRFSGGFAGPDKSIAGRVTRPDDALWLPEVQDQLHVSTAVVSTALARSDAVSCSNLDNSTVIWQHRTGCSAAALRLGLVPRTVCQALAENPR